MNATPFQKLQLDTTLSLAVIVAGLLVSWFASVESPGHAAARIAREDQATVSETVTGYRMTVTAQRPHDFVRAPAPASAAPQEADPT